MSDHVKFPVPLWSPSESTTMDLSPRFVFLCKSTEFFVASYADAIGFDHVQPSIIQGQVGIRCIYCAKRVDIKYEDKFRSMAFPRSIEDTAYCVQFLGLMHTMTCPSASFLPILNDQPDKTHLEQLSAYCLHKCETLNIVSRAPHMPGLFLRQLPIKKPKHFCFNSLEDFASLDIMDDEKHLIEASKVEKYEPPVNNGQYHHRHGYHPLTYYGGPSYNTGPFFMQNDLTMKKSGPETGYKISSIKAIKSEMNNHSQKKRPLDPSFDYYMRSPIKKVRINSHEIIESSNHTLKSGSNTGRDVIPTEIKIGPYAYQNDRLSCVDDESGSSSRGTSSQQIVTRRVNECSAIELLNLAMDMMERGEGYIRPDRTNASTSQKEVNIAHTLDQTARQSLSSTMISRDDSRKCNLTDIESRTGQNLSHENNRNVSRSSKDTIDREPSDASKSSTRNALTTMRLPGDNDFPYFKDVFGSWVCRFCCYMPFTERAVGSIWQGNIPPDNQFMQSHLHTCNSFSQYQISMTSNTVEDKSLKLIQENSVSTEGAIQVIDDVRNQIESVQTTNVEPQPRLKIREKQALYRKSMIAKTRKPEAIVSALAYLDDYESGTSDNGDYATLISNDDRPLISDFMFHIIKQLRMCSLDETDQKGRGKTRATFEIGFMGVQCNHCKSKPRKFFWTNVSRFNNSFSSEIISHVMSCCPTEPQKHLLELKKIHSEQMSYLPRGSQKLFFDRLWERLHSNRKTAHTIRIESTKSGLIEDSITGHIENTDNFYLGKESLEEIKRLSEESLVLNHDSILDKENCFSFGSTTAVKGVFLLLSLKRILDPPILLAVDEDFLFLPQYDCFIRSNLEVFCDNKSISKSASFEKWSCIENGSVGIRCVHCVGCRDAYDENAVSFPESLSCIRQSAHSIASNHLGRCPCLPKATKDAFLRMHGKSNNISSDLATKYYASAGSALGIVSAPSGFGLVLSKSEGI